MRESGVGDEKSGVKRWAEGVGWSVNCYPHAPVRTRSLRKLILNRSLQMFIVHNQTSKVSKVGYLQTIHQTREAKAPTLLLPTLISWASSLGFARCKPT